MKGEKQEECRGSWDLEKIVTGNVRNESWLMEFLKHGVGQFFWDQDFLGKIQF